MSENNILAGAGSSDLIFLALRHRLNRNSRVLILDPMYGEYAHVLEKVTGCTVERLRLAKDKNYAVPPDELANELQHTYDWVVLVNPNSPTGQHLPKETLKTILRAAPPSVLLNIPYYEEKWRETHLLREQLSRELQQLGWEVFPSCANYLLCHLPTDQSVVADLIQACRRRKLILSRSNSARRRSSRSKLMGPIPARIDRQIECG